MNGLGELDTLATLEERLKNCEEKLEEKVENEKFDNTVSEIMEMIE